MNGYILGRALEEAAAHARALAEDLERADDLALELADTVMAASALASPSTHILAPVRRRAIARNRLVVIADTLEKACGLAAAIDADRKSIRAHELAADLVYAHAYATDFAADLTRARGQRMAARRVVRSATGLVAAAARLLPTAERARYAEEYRSELWEIAHAGGRRPVQLAYASRQVMAAWRLRAELRAPRRRGAVQ